MRKRLDTCQELAAKATFWNFDPLVEAISNMYKSFSFETDEMNLKDLFGGQTLSIMVFPAEFENRLQDQFTRALAGWQQLKDASEVLFTTVRESFSHAKFDELFALAKEKGIPDRWLRTHPLYGDDASDNKFWETLTELRNTDPIGFLARVKELKCEENNLNQRLLELIDSVERPKSFALPELPELDAVCDPEDDPDITFTQARHEEEVLAGLLMTSDSENEIDAQAVKIVKAWQKCRKQIDAVTQSKQNLDVMFERVETERLAVVKLIHEVDERIQSAQKVHGDVKSASEAFAAAGEFYAEAGRVMLKAERQKTENRFLNASATSVKALDVFVKAWELFQKVNTICDGLDAKKKKFEADLASMEEKRIAAEQKLARFGKGAELSYTAPVIEAVGVKDYDALQRVLDSQQDEWNQQVRTAQRFADDAAEIQRRSNAAMARQRRQVKELEASRQRNQQSSQYNVGFAVGYVSGGSRQEDDASSYRPSTSTYSAPETPSYSQPDPTPSPSYPDTSTTDTSWSTDSNGSNVSDNSW